jgi:nucleoid-associated protein YgaU
VAVPHPGFARLRDGDTLPELAQRFLGSTSRAPEIYDANRDLLSSPDLLPVGLSIVIPPRERFEDLEPAGS